MALFANQPMICCICKAEIMFSFNYHGVPVCDTKCWDEYQWRKTLFIMGKKYHPKVEKQL